MRRLFIGKTTLGRLMTVCGIPIMEHHELDKVFILYVDGDANTSSVHVSSDEGPYEYVESGYVESVRRLCQGSGLL